MAIFITDSYSSAKDVRRRMKMNKTALRSPSKKWHTDRKHNAYSSKLIETLRRVRRSTQADEAPRRSRAIREAADRILAIEGRGQTRWSRAILSRRNPGLRQCRPHKAAYSPSQPKFFAAGYNGLYATMKKRSQVIKCKAGVLGRLIPGCRRLSFPTLLEEASDYISALEMQVRAMAALADILSASAGFSSPEPDRSEP